MKRGQTVSNRKDMLNGTRVWRQRLLIIVFEEHLRSKG